MKIFRIKIEATFSLPSGDYGIYSSSKGRKWTKDFGYAPGDDVELHFEPGDNQPKKIIINGTEQPAR